MVEGDRRIDENKTNIRSNMHEWESSDTKDWERNTSEVEQL